MIRYKKIHQSVITALLFCMLQLSGTGAHAQAPVAPAQKDSTILGRELPKARARRDRSPDAEKDSLAKDSLIKTLKPIRTTVLDSISFDSTSIAKAQIADSLDIDRKSTRLNSSHANISYAVFCLKKKM